MERDKWGLQNLEFPPSVVSKGYRHCFCESAKNYEQGDIKLVLSKLTETIADKTFLETK